jgi:hypothetical protein
MVSLRSPFMFLFVLGALQSDFPEARSLAMNPGFSIPLSSNLAK